MGHIVNPISIRLGYNKIWNSNWNSYHYKNYKKPLSVDFLTKDYFLWFSNQKYLERLGLIISHYTLLRKKNKVKIVLYFYDGKLLNLTNDLLTLLKRNQFIENTESYSKLIENYLWIRLQMLLWNKIIKLFYENLKRILSNYEIELLVKTVNNDNIPAKVLSKYIATRLSQRYSLLDVINPLVKTLKENKNLEGFRINCSGRFTRKQLASYLWWKEGQVPVNTFNSLIDYAKLKVKLRYGICGIKVWLRYKNNQNIEPFIYKIKNIK